MLSNFIDTSSWTHAQWLAACIFVFVALSLLILLYRIFQIFRITRQSAHQPNLRPLRRGRVKNSTKPIERNDEG